MVQIQQKGKSQNKRFQFYAPTELVDEFITKKGILESHSLVINMTDDFVKTLKDGIKAMDKHLAELTENQKTSTDNTN